MATKEELASVAGHTTTTNPAAAGLDRGSRTTAAGEFAKTGFVGKERQEHGCKCGDGRASIRSVNSSNALLSINGYGAICTMNGVGCVLVCNGIGSFACFNSLFSIYSMQSVLSINSVNCFVCYNACDGAFRSNAGCGDDDEGAGAQTTIDMHWGVVGGTAIICTMILCAVLCGLAQKWKKRTDGPARFNPQVV